MKKIITTTLFFVLAAGAWAGIATRDTAGATSTPFASPPEQSCSCPTPGATSGQEMPSVILAQRSVGQCMGACASEQGMCIGQCQGDGRCISACAATHGRCVARCQ